MQGEQGLSGELRGMFAVCMVEKIGEDALFRARDSHGNQTALHHTYKAKSFVLARDEAKFYPSGDQKGG